MEEKRVALDIVLQVQDNHLEKRSKNGSFSPQNGPPHGTTAWETPYCTPSCNPLTGQSLWKKNGPHWRRLLDAPVIIMNFQDDRPENRLKTAIFWTLNCP